MIALKILLTLAVLCTCCYLGACQLYSCPPVGLDQVAICEEDCSSDADCESLLKCCSNGCGHVCTPPTTTPYHQPPYECPVIESDMAGICQEDCANDTECTSGHQCCSNGCGHTCVSICNLINMNLANQTLIGAFVPQCEEDGNFSAVQCHGSSGYCWCVDTVSGEPLSEPVREELQCSCTHEGEMYRIGEVFRDSDGFNSCSCTVTGVKCTNNTVFYSCPAIREDEDAGICVAECLLDSECSSDTKCCYTGCGYSCMTPVITPYIPIPTMDNCPPTNQVPCVLDDGGSCADGSSDESSSDYACDDETSLCCENDCLSAVCVYRTGPSPCWNARKIARERNSTRDSMVGRYSPQCDFDGHFKAVQCHEHFCWCVDKHTGKPESDIVPFENLDSLHCTSCVYEGHKYGYMAEFPAGDGCNTCSCVYDGVVSCTEIGCEVPEENALWGWWHSVLIYCVVAVIVLTLLVLVLLVAVVITMKKNKFRHRRLKEVTAVHFESDMDAVYFKQGQDLNTVELKVPVEDVDHHEQEQPKA